MSLDVWFHIATLLIMVFGIAAPALRVSSRLKNLMRDFPPHRHDNGRILFPAGYDPPASVSFNSPSDPRN